MSYKQYLDAKKCCNLNSVGPQGAQGLRGLPGPIGPKGYIGDTGYTGSTGAQGATGAIGAQGATGAQGLQGVTGIPGSVAGRGDTGFTGAQGATGAQGLQGVTGIPGSVAGRGDTGFTGATGATGSQGVTGSTGAQGATGPVNLLVQLATNEPMGHVDRTTSDISFNYLTRTFTIAPAPASGSYQVWIQGQLFTISTHQSVTINPDATGLYYIFFSIVAGNATLGIQQTFFIWDQQAPTAYIYYNSLHADEYMLFDERHGITMDWATHEYLHRTRGAAIANGFGITYPTLEIANPTNADLQFNLVQGTFFDEDLQVDITDGASGIWDISLNPVLLPVLYNDGTSWRKTTASNIPLYNSGSVSGRPFYNDASLNECPNNDFINMWIAATNMAYTPIIAIMGQDYYTNVDKAKSAQWQELNLTGLPIVELRPLYQMTYKCSSNFSSNNYFSSLYYVTDIRSFSSITGIAAANTGAQGATGSISPTGSYWGQALNWNDLSNSWQITGNGPLAFGNYAGQTSQGTAAIAIGIQAGQNLQQSGAIAIGYNAGQYLQGTNSIAIGAYAGATGQPQNSIIINASGNTLSGIDASSCYIYPINTHANSSTLNLLLYDTNTSEVVRSTDNSSQNKTFVIEHPVDKNKYLVHACLEGPEGGIYYRGEGKIINNTHVTIELPYYVKNIGTDFTIQVTPIYSGKNIQLSTSRIENNKFTVYSNNGNVDFFWMVNGKRTNIDVEPYKNNVLIKGDGPYKWL